MKKLNLLFLILTIISTACEQDPVSSNTGISTMRLTAQYVNTSTTDQPMGLTKSSPAVAAIEISRARFLIRNVSLRSVPEDSVEFVSDPYIIDLNLEGQLSSISVEDVPANTYDRIDFRIHRLDDDDPRDLAYFQHPDFKDFMDDNRYSVIIDGTIQEGTNPPETFVFKSRDNEKQRRFFNPVLVVDESTNQITIVFEFKGTNWFVTDEGAILDPRDESNEKEISDNLRASIGIVEKKIVNDSIGDDNYQGDNNLY